MVAIVKELAGFMFCSGRETCTLFLHTTFGQYCNSRTHIYNECGDYECQNVVCDSSHCKRSIVRLGNVCWLVAGGEAC